MPKGLDTTRNLSATAVAIKASGCAFVARYLSQSHWKLVEQPEVDAIMAAGLNLVLVYEDAPTSTDYFSFGRGQADGARAAQQAHSVSAPAGTVLYFAVDYDASSDAITGVITQYFNGVSSALKSFSATDLSCGGVRFRGNLRRDHRERTRLMRLACSGAWVGGVRQLYRLVYSPGDAGEYRWAVGRSRRCDGQLRSHDLRLTTGSDWRQPSAIGAGSNL